MGLVPGQGVGAEERVPLEADVLAPTDEPLRALSRRTIQGLSAYLRNVRSRVSTLAYVMELPESAPTISGGTP